MNKKNIYVKILLPITFIYIVISIIFYFLFVDWLENDQRIKTTLLLEKIAAVAKTKEDSFEIDKELKPIIDRDIKNFGLLYIMVIDNNKEIIAHNHKKDIGKIAKSNVANNIVISNKMITEQAGIINEIGMPIDFKRGKGGAIIGLSMNDLIIEKTMIIFVLVIGLMCSVMISFFILNYMNNYMHKEYSEPSYKLELLCQKISSEQNVNSEEFNIGDSLSNVSTLLSKIYQNTMSLKGKVNKFGMDDLTGLFSYQYMKEQISYELSRAKRYKRFFSCLVLEINNFESVFDICGIAKTDFTIKDISGFIKSNLRNVDMVGKLDKYSFVLILPEIQESQALIVAERLIKSVTNYEIIHQKKQINLKVSIGINSFHKDSKENIDENAFVFQIEKALRNARLAGENQIYINNETAIIQENPNPEAT